MTSKITMSYTLVYHNTDLLISSSRKHIAYGKVGMCYRSMGMATRANKTMPFVMLIGLARQFEAYRSKSFADQF